MRRALLCGALLACVAAGAVWYFEYGPGDYAPFGSAAAKRHTENTLRNRLNDSVFRLADQPFAPNLTRVDGVRLTLVVSEKWDSFEPEARAWFRSAIEQQLDGDSWPQPVDVEFVDLSGREAAPPMVIHYDQNEKRILRGPGT